MSDEAETCENNKNSAKRDEEKKPSSSSVSNGGGSFLIEDILCHNNKVMIDHLTQLWSGK